MEFTKERRVKHCMRNGEQIWNGLVWLKKSKIGYLKMK